MAPGSMALDAEEPFQEGIRLPLEKLYDRGTPNEAVFAKLKAVTFSGKHPGTNAQRMITDGIPGSWGGRERFDGVEGISSPGANLSN